MDAYERLEFLGKGTTGSVHKLRRRTDGCLFVEKQVVLTGFSELQRSEILNEASVMSQLLHPNVVAYEDSFVSEDMLHIIMELLPGGDLAQELRRKGSPLEEEKIWSILAQVCEGLQHLHSRRILHRDIKPENIFADGRGMYKIGDLGLGRVLSTQSSHARTGVGTPLYFSPEMCEERPYNEKSDVWALGCLTYELCSLSPPFMAANQMALARKITSSTPAPLAAHFSMELQFLVMKMLEKDVSKRPSASQILEYSPVRARLPEIRSLRDNAKLLARQARWGPHLHSKVVQQRHSLDSFRDSHLRLAWRAQYDSPPLTVAAARTRPSEAALSPVLSSALCDKPPSPPVAAVGSDTTSPTRPGASPSVLPPSTPSAQIQSNAAPTLSPATPPFTPIATGCWDSPSSAETPRVRGGRVPLPDGVTKVRCRCSRSPSSCGMTPRVASMASQRSSPLGGTAFAAKLACSDLCTAHRYAPPCADHSSGDGGDGFRSATELGEESDLRYKNNSNALQVVAGQTTSTSPPVSTPECSQPARMPQHTHSEKRVLSEAQAIGEAHAAWVASGGKASAVLEIAQLQGRLSRLQAELHDASASNNALREEIRDSQQQVQQLTQALKIEQDERLRERNEAEQAAEVLRERLEQSAREKKKLLEQMSVMREQLSASTAKVYHADRIAAMLQLHCSKLDEELNRGIEITNLLDSASATRKDSRPGNQSDQPRQHLEEEDVRQHPRSSSHEETTNSTPTSPSEHAFPFEKQAAPLHSPLHSILPPSHAALHPKSTDSSGIAPGSVGKGTPSAPTCAPAASSQSSLSASPYPSIARTMHRSPPSLSMPFELPPAHLGCEGEATPPSTRPCTPGLGLWGQAAAQADVLEGNAHCLGEHDPDDQSSGFWARTPSVSSLSPSRTELQEDQEGTAASRTAATSELGASHTQRQLRALRRSSQRPDPHRRWPPRNRPCKSAPTTPSRVLRRPEGITAATSDKALPQLPVVSLQLPPSSSQNLPESIALVYAWRRADLRVPTSLEPPKADFESLTWLHSSPSWINRQRIVCLQGSSSLLLLVRYDERLVPVDSIKDTGPRVRSLRVRFRHEDNFRPLRLPAELALPQRNGESAIPRWRMLNLALSLTRQREIVEFYLELEAPHAVSEVIAIRHSIPLLRTAILHARASSSNVGIQSPIRSPSTIPSMPSTPQHAIGLAPASAYENAQSAVLSLQRASGRTPQLGPPLRLVVPEEANEARSGQRQAEENVHSKSLITSSLQPRSAMSSAGRVAINSEERSPLALLKTHMKSKRRPGLSSSPPSAWGSLADAASPSSAFSADSIEGWMLQRKGAHREDSNSHSESFVTVDNLAAHSCSATEVPVDSAAAAASADSASCAHGARFRHQTHRPSCSVEVSQQRTELMRAPEVAASSVPSKQPAARVPQTGGADTAWPLSVAQLQALLNRASIRQSQDSGESHGMRVAWPDAVNESVARPDKDVHTDKWMADAAHASHKFNRMNQLMREAEDSLNHPHDLACRQKGPHADSAEKDNDCSQPFCAVYDSHLPRAHVTQPNSSHSKQTGMVESSRGLRDTTLPEEAHLRATDCVSEDEELLTELRRLRAEARAREKMANGVRCS